LANRAGLRLDFNENTAGCSPRVLQRLRELGAEELGCYPERTAVEAIVARHLGIEAEQLLLTNGIDEGIHLLCEAFVEPEDEVLIVVPTFAMYKISAAATGAKVIDVPAEKDFAFPVRELLTRLTPRTRLIAVANPNNPTGMVAACDDLLEVAGAAPNAAVLIDEAYFEFCGQTMLGAWRDVPNLFVTRTFSKAYGLAGLRAGVLAGDAAQIAMVRKLASPYNVNAVALACLPEALADQEYVGRYVNEVCLGRNMLQRELSKWGIRCWPSHANFVLAELGSPSSAFVSSLREQGILVRDRSSDHGCQGCVRITLGTLPQTERLLVALRQAIEDLGIKKAAAV
jgi:histidinol-phosphate aminotransferase